MEDGSARLRLGGPLCSESLWATPWENTPGVTPQINGCAGAEVTRPTFPGQNFRSSNLRLTAQGVGPYTRPVLAGSLLWETQSLECLPTHQRLTTYVVRILGSANKQASSRVPNRKPLATLRVNRKRLTKLQPEQSVTNLSQNGLSQNGYGLRCICMYDTYVCVIHMQYMWTPRAF